MILKLKCASESLGRLVKTLFDKSHSQSFWFTYSGWDLRICIFYGFQEIKCCCSGDYTLRTTIKIAVAFRPLNIPWTSPYVILQAHQPRWTKAWLVQLNGCLQLGGIHDLQSMSVNELQVRGNKLRHGCLLSLYHCHMGDDMTDGKMPTATIRGYIISLTAKIMKTYGDSYLKQATW